MLFEWNNIRFLKGLIREQVIFSGIHDGDPM
jgi:hypothetical protein